MTKATIMNIQKYSLHDGPGIRTTVFFKGCPLNCWWCHNPESHSVKHEIMFFSERCTNCGKCIKKCPQNALETKENYPIVDENKCKLCGKCSEFCPHTAREYVGEDLTAHELMKQIIKDEVFYEESGGGVTFSGGEPLVYSDFLKEVLKMCKTRGIHTAIETSGYAPWEKLEQIADKIDLFLYDIKLMDKEMHKNYTGVENAIILENLRKLSERGCNINIRMPIIAGINEDEDNINAIIEFLSNIKVLQVNLLPYHKMGMSKYEKLKKKYKLTGTETPSEEKMKEIENKFKKQGFKVTIGG